MICLCRVLSALVVLLHIIFVIGVDFDWTRRESCLTLLIGHVCVWLWLLQAECWSHFGQDTEFHIAADGCFMCVMYECVSKRMNVTNTVKRSVSLEKHNVSSSPFTTPFSKPQLFHFFFTPLNYTVTKRSPCDIFHNMCRIRRTLWNMRRLVITHDRFADCVTLSLLY